ncbi:hypothetical protein K438DRAFT_1989705 [Mycena galopus ATCC 62051]|nr:hypothetical protein K438DRAFT_1989705 [Mycena galopus ATCC 62051]
MALAQIVYAKGFCASPSPSSDHLALKTLLALARTPLPPVPRLRHLQTMKRRAAANGARGHLGYWINYSGLSNRQGTEPYIFAIGVLDRQQPNASMAGFYFGHFAFVWRSVFLDRRILLAVGSLDFNVFLPSSMVDLCRGLWGVIVALLSPWCHDPAVFAASASRALIWKLPPVVSLVALLFTVIRRMFSSKWGEHVVGAKLQKRTKALEG